MRVDPAGLAAGATAADGSVLAFDSTKCLFRYRLEHADVRDAWVTDYYARGHVAIGAAFFVLGSDVMGSMGPDLVALANRDDSARFTREHHGASVLSLGEVTRSVIDGLFGTH